MLFSEDRVLTLPTASRQSTASPTINIQNLYNDPDVEYDQILLCRALPEIANCSPQERKEVYEALKRSMQDSEKISNQRLGICLSRDFTDSDNAGSECDSSINGTDIQENMAQVAKNHEGTETPQRTASCRSSKSESVTSRHMSCASHEAIRCDLAENGESSVIMSDLESDSDSEYVSESSEFEKDPSTASAVAATAAKGKESEDLPSAAVRTRSVPLMGLFGIRNNAARRRTIANRNATRRHLDMRAQRPCYGCEIKGGERLANGEVVSGSKW